MTTPVTDRPAGSYTSTTASADAPSTTGTVDEHAVAPWPTWQRVAFRFVFVYLILYNLPFPLSLPPLGGPVATSYNRLWYSFIPWVGTHVLGLAKPITVFPSGTGDTRYNYVQILVYVALAALATIVWSVADRQRPQYRSLYHLLRVYIRYALAFPLLMYGAAKVLPMQFPTPTLGTLLQPYGEFTPMSALWSWMGISRGYNLYAGLAEMIPGVLLLVRRTTTLGALLGAAALSNVVTMNFAYDVPVKLFSSHLLVMALFLLAPDLRRVFDAFVLNRPIPASDLGPYPASVLFRNVRRVTKPIVVAVAIGVPLVIAKVFSSRVGEAVKPPLYGAYEVESFVRNADTIPPLMTDGTRWRRLLVSRPGAISVRLMTDTSRQFFARIDTATSHLTLAPATDSTRKFALTYVIDGSRLSIDGPFGSDTLHVVLRRLDEAKFRVLRRGFHWVTE